MPPGTADAIPFTAEAVHRSGSYSSAGAAASEPVRGMADLLCCIHPDRARRAHSALAPGGCGGEIVAVLAVAVRCVGAALRLTINVTLTPLEISYR
jgi:hypothetical protein